MQLAALRRHPPFLSQVHRLRSSDSGETSHSHVSRNCAYTPALLLFVGTVAIGGDWESGILKLTCTISATTSKVFSVLRITFRCCGTSMLRWLFTRRTTNPTRTRLSIS